MFDICPFMSIGKDTPVECLPQCALFDTKLKECAFSTINGNTKRLTDIENKLDMISTAIGQLDVTIQMKK